MARTPRSRIETIPAPSLGWAVSENFTEASPRGAQVLENWLPTQRGARLRKGATKRATIGADVEAFILHTSTSRLIFAADETAIYDVTNPADVDVAPVPSVSGLTSGDWISHQMATAGGEFAVAVNGADFMQQFDGTDWNPVTTAGLNTLDYDALVTDFAVGETVTGGTSGATATIIGINATSATAGTLKLGSITSGPYQNNEALTSVGGAATADGASASGSAVTVTNVATTALSFVWEWGRRLWFVEKDTLSAWYLPAASIGGAAAEFPLNGVFKKGGHLLFGASWSMSDAGVGMDDRLVFVSTEGEVAVYAGTDPASAATIGLVGVYDIGRPMGKRAWIRAGGDVLFATEHGLVPLTAAVGRDPASLSFGAVSTAIEPEWRRRVANKATDWLVTKSSGGQWGMVVTDADNLAINLPTGGWALWTGWAPTATAEFNGGVYFGDAAGFVYEAESGGSDNGVPYECRLATAYNHLRAASHYKHLHMMRATFRAQTSFNAKLSVSRDYAVRFPASPMAAMSDPASLFGTALFGTAAFGGLIDSTVTTQWRDIHGNARVLSGQVQVVCDDDVAPVVEMASIDVLYDIGGSVV